MEKRKESCSGCYFRAKQVASLEHEFKANLDKKTAEEQGEYF